MQRQRAAVVGAAWALKWKRQTGDLAAMKAGRIVQDELVWFSGGRTPDLRIVGAPY